jgi:uncharacterized delta-60 repeat protein
MGFAEQMVGSPRRRKLVCVFLALVSGLVIWGVGESVGAGTVVPVVRLSEPPVPQDAAPVGVAFSDLASGGGGKLLASTNTYRSGGYFAVARMTAEGALDRAFGANGYTKPVHLSRANDDQLRGWAVARQGSRIILAGFQENEFGGTAPILARFSAGGRLDHHFGSRGVVAPRPASEGQDPRDPYYRLKGGGRILDIAVRPDGEIIAVGGIDEESGPKPAATVTAYRPDGSLDKGFGTDGRVLVPEPRQGTYTGFSKVELLPGGKVLAAGYLHGRLALLGLDSGGRPDRAFGGGDGLVTPGVAKETVCCSTVATLATTKSGRILLGGVAHGKEQSPFVLLRLKLDGSPDSSFGRKGVAPFSPGRNSTKVFDPYSMTVGPSGRVVVAGIAERVGPQRRISSVPVILAYRASGKVDWGFAQSGAEFPGDEQAGLAVATTTTAGGTYIAGGFYELFSGRPKYHPLLVRLGSSQG